MQQQSYTINVTGDSTGNNKYSSNDSDSGTKLYI